MMKEKTIFEISQQIAEVELLNNRLMSAKTWQDKHKVIDSIFFVGQFFDQHPLLQRFLKKLNISGQFLIKALVAIGQGAVAFQKFEEENISFEQLVEFTSFLNELEIFYNTLGGLVGYHLAMLKLIDLKKKKLHPQNDNVIHFDEPEGVDLSNDSVASHQFVRWGLEHMDEMAEIYPIGGAGDRLNLQDEIGQCLPAAQLLFCGRSLFEGMIRDLEGREFLHYKLFGKQIATPIAIMTSHEKNNHEHILKICEGHQWFGRNKSSFFFFIQMLVPMITTEGFWAMYAPLRPILKPGGHGVLWKTALDHGLFEWLEQRGCSKALVRQINNPMAGIDNGLLALSGIGCHKKKKFGFASCPRLLNMPEGIDVLREKHLPKEYEYCITNIEYTEFDHYGIQDAPKTPDSPYSHFPANTNILYVDLEAIKPHIQHNPIPGAIINMKTKVTCLSPGGEKNQYHAGRLESSMQNIADYIVDKFPQRLQKGQRGDLSSFLTFNERKKTISVTKQAFEEGKSFAGTPEGCHYELMQNYHDLLSNNCHFKLPPLNDEMSYLTSGPVVLINFHPALGMLYDVISQKLRGGRIATSSEWMMEISEVEIVNLDLNGSLLIEAKSVMGKQGSDGMIVYDSANCGKCTLINVTVQNQGIHSSSKNVFWKHQVARKECLEIILHGNAEFFAEDVRFKGDFHFEIPDGHRMSVEQKNEQIVWHIDKIDAPTWMWHYTFNKQNKIVLSKIQTKKHV